MRASVAVVFLLAVAASLPSLAAQTTGVTQPPSERPELDLVIELSVPSEGGRELGWSPKGASVPLTADADRLVGSFALGPAGIPPVRVELRRSRPDAPYDALHIDLDRDGSFGEDEVVRTEPRENRGKLWSSFSAVVDLPTRAPDDTNIVLPYPMSLWFVADPAEPDAAPALRWSRRGWLEGLAKHGEQQVGVVLTEMVMDGVFDERDSWALADGAKKDAERGEFRRVDDHNWLGETAWRIVDVHPSGTRLTLRPFDPGMTRVAEAAARDRFAADRRAPRAPSPVPFGHDFEAAVASAKADGKPLFVDFETTWCGPCKQMDSMVYNAQAVVDAAVGVVAVKVDGDARKDLTERFDVRGYPTLILLAHDGTEIRRAVGYQSVIEMAAFFAMPNEQR